MWYVLRLRTTRGILTLSVFDRCSTVGLATHSMAALAQQVWQHILETLHCKLAQSEHDEALVCRHLQPSLVFEST